jgi:hypothetical protein
MRVRSECGRNRWLTEFKSPASPPSLTEADRTRIAAAAALTAQDREDPVPAGRYPRDYFAWRELMRAAVEGFVVRRGPMTIICDATFLRAVVDAWLQCRQEGPAGPPVLPSPLSYAFDYAIDRYQKHAAAWLQDCYGAAECDLAGLMCRVVGACDRVNVTVVVDRVQDLVRAGFVDSASAEYASAVVAAALDAGNAEAAVYLATRAGLRPDGVAPLRARCIAAVKDRVAHLEAVCAQLAAPDGASELGVDRAAWRPPPRPDWYCDKTLAADLEHLERVRKPEIQALALQSRRLREALEAGVAVDPEDAREVLHFWECLFGWVAQCFSRSGQALAEVLAPAWEECGMAALEARLLGPGKSRILAEAYALAVSMQEYGAAMWLQDRYGDDAVGSSTACTRVMFAQDPVRVRAAVRLGLFTPPDVRDVEGLLIPEWNSEDFDAKVYMATRAGFPIEATAAALAGPAGLRSLAAKLLKRTQKALGYMLAAPT